MSDTFFEIRNSEGYTLVRFTGFMDASTVAKIRPALLADVPLGCAHFIVDLSQVDFVDSHGVGLFVTLLKRAHANHGKLFIAGAQGQPAAVLGMVGLNGSFVAYCDTAEEAVKQVAP